MPAWRLLILALLWIPACGGGGSNSDPPDPPGPPYADTINTRLPVALSLPGAAVQAFRFWTGVSETEAGTDLNGDGDQLDQVLHEVDTTTDLTRNLGFAIVGPIVPSDLHLAFLVVESAQGASDLNGDGDTADAVWFVYDPALPLGTGNPRNTGWATPATGLDGAGTRFGFVLLRSEASEGADLNGDGDLQDLMGGAFDGVAFAPTTVVAGPHVPGRPLVARNGRVLLTLSEPGAAMDSNGDGDASDIILLVVDFHPGIPTVLLAGAGGGRAIAANPYVLTDNAAVYFIDEASNGALDLNVDGDATDAILAVYDVGGGTGEATPVTLSIPGFATAASPAFGIAASAQRVLVGIDETSNGARDLNGDMDTVDTVGGWVDTGSTTKGSLLLIPLPLGPVPPRIDGTRGLITVSEMAMGAVQGVDLNGDGDTNDNVAHAIDAVGPGNTVNLGLAVGMMRVDGTDGFLGISEAGQGGGDLNGDADANDIVLRYLDMGDFPPTGRNLGIVASALGVVRMDVSDVRVALLVPEGQSANFDDLNKDGDRSDTGIVLLKLDAVPIPPVLVASTPFFAGTASLFAVPPLMVGTDVVVFPTSEALDAATDLNGDGDATDTVARYARIRPANGGTGGLGTG